MLGIDLFVDETKKWVTATLTGSCCSAPRPARHAGGRSATTALDLFDGRYVVDEFALVLKALFLLAGLRRRAAQPDELEEGGYYQGEYYVLLLAACSAW